MFKIGPKIQNFQKKANRYLSKNTTRAKYNRSMDLMTISGIATGVQLFRMPVWDICDMGITSGLAVTTYGALGNALRHLIHLQPIRKRAIKIKKLAKLNANI